MRRRLLLLLICLMTSGCVSYPPRIVPANGQSAVRQDADARECDHQVHGPGRLMVTELFTAWSARERDAYVACMQARGYEVQK